MPTFYVRSTDGSDADNGTTWALAKATLAGALAIAAAGDTIWVSQVHAETAGATNTLTSPGTAVAPVRILCGSDAAEPPTALASTATVTTTGTFGIVFGAGWAYVYGITFTSANGSGNISMAFNVNSSGWTLEACSLAIATTSSAARIAIGNASALGLCVEWRNTTVSFAAAQGINVLGGRLTWLNTSSALLGTIPTILFNPGSSANGEVVVANVDLSAAGSGKSLVNGAPTSPAKARYEFRNCKLGASVSVITGVIANQGSPIVRIDNCDSGDTNIRFEPYRFAGSIVQETTKVRSGGATDGTTVQSHKLVTLASGPSLFSPLEGPWIEFWNDTDGSAITVTIELCTENVVLTNAQAWLEVEYLGTASFPLALLSSSRVASALATPANLTTSAASWAGFTTAAPQKIALTFTPQSKGPMRARICVAKANESVYVDPLISSSVGLASGKQYLLAGFGVINEQGSSGGGTASIFQSPVVRAA